MRRSFHCLICILLLVLVGCDNAEPPPQATPEREKQTAPAASSVSPVEPVGCKGCHEEMELDKNHNLLCSTCHQGEAFSSDQDEAHTGLISKPAHPDHMASSCGKCHPEVTANLVHAAHFTLTNEVNQVRHHFGANEVVASAQEAPLPEVIEDAQDLADDMLRRRCLRCHLFAGGDDYPSVAHGTGCAACHLRFDGGVMEGHAFSKPDDRRCLSCHYGNFVGMDYYGGYEHDFNWEYRTPYTTWGEFFRPYGVENHELAPDLHQQAGLVCLDCHTANMHRAASNTLSCRTCHGWQPGDPPAQANLTDAGGALVLQSRSGKQLIVPVLKDSAHAEFGDRVDCEVCHAQWSFNDSPTYLMRSENDDFDPWTLLTVQGSSEIEALLENNLFSEDDELEPAMTDTISGRTLPGIWYKGFGQRRWEAMLVDVDHDGRIRVFRPLLDLHLSSVDENGEVQFDEITGSGSGNLPYTPHTTGHAGLFYRERFQHLLPASDATHR